MKNILIEIGIVIGGLVLFLIFFAPWCGIFSVLWIRYKLGKGKHPLAPDIIAYGYPLECYKR